MEGLFIQGKNVDGRTITFNTEIQTGWRHFWAITNGVFLTVYSCYPSIDWLECLLHLDSDIFLDVFRKFFGRKFEIATESLFAEKF
jgi:hypothetical protein